VSGARKTRAWLSECPVITQPHTHCRRERCAVEPADGTRARRPSRAASSSSTSCFQTGIISGGTGGTNRGWHQDHWRHQPPPARSPGMTPSEGLWCDPTKIPTRGALPGACSSVLLAELPGIYWAEALWKSLSSSLGSCLPLGAMSCSIQLPFPSPLSTVLIPSHCSTAPGTHPWPQHWGWN